ncbi:MAG TPA: hypothetical protein VJT31_02545 [Rugosimonospora sp.]|nr:hypothetical protein [Rugosimonospora sp.]
MVVLAGRLDQSSLEELRRLLGLKRVGRLTDLEDAQFGHRDVGPNGDATARLDLWRDAVDQWHVSLSARQDTAVADDEIERWATEAEAAATAVGLQVVERRLFPGRNPPDYRTTWRNESWLRTMHWDLPAQSLHELWTIIGVSPSGSAADKRAALIRFMDSPTWEPAPDRIRQEADAFLRATEGV